MLKCKIGDFNIEYKHNYGWLPIACQHYLADFEKPDLSIEITPEYLKQMFAEAKIWDSEERFEAVLAYRMLADRIASRGAFVLHSALFDADGVGVALAAHSGTGKTTHLRLLKQLLGGRLTVINGDKPLVRFFGDIPYGYGTPWNGKEHYGKNARTQLRHICFIERSETNFVEPMDKSAALTRIFTQLYIPKDPAEMAAVLSLVDKLFSSCRLWVIHCNMDISAAEATYNTVIKPDLE